MKSKKDFTGGLSSLLGETPVPAPVETSAKSKLEKEVREITKTSQIGTKPNETRATFIVNEQDLEKVKAIAYWDRVDIKEVVAFAFSDYLRSYEQANGPIKSIPKK